MTALCGGGPSEPRPGVQPTVSLSGYGIAGALALAGFAPVAEAVSAIVSGTTLVTSIFCANDPPADPGLTPTDISNALLFTQPSIQIPAAQKVANWFLNQHWYDICQCTNVQTPAPSAPSNPGPAGTNTGLPPGQPTNCLSYQGPISFTGTNGSTATTNLNSLLLPPSPLGRSLAVTGTNWTVPAVPIPSGFTGWTEQSQFNPTSTVPVGSGGSVHIGHWTSSGGFISYGSVFGSQDANVNGPATFQNPSGAAYWATWGEAEFGTTGYYQWNVNWSLQCAGPGFASPCCPPDPSVDLRFRQIIDIVNQILQAQQPVSKSWTTGTVHTGISGTGSFNIAQGVTGIRATFTTIPADIQITPGTPTFYWSLGFVTPLAMTYPLRSLRTVFQTQDLPLPIQADGISYTFPAGVVVNLTELLPA